MLKRWFRLVRKPQAIRKPLRLCVEFLEDRHLPAVTFNAGLNFPSGGTAPDSVRLGDLNGDGNPDMVLVNAVSNDLAVLLGNGSGLFAAGTTFATSPAPDTVRLGDINGDGKLDAVVSTTNSLINTLLGNGNGTFQAFTSFSDGGTGTEAMVLGDVNGDSKLDIVTANFTSNNISVLLGNGNGTFTAPATFATNGIGTRSLAIADFNGDNKSDVITANQTGSNLSYLQGNGDGTFVAGTTIAMGGTGPRNIRTGDFNGDNKQDVVTANQDSNNASVLLGNGNGTFGAATTLQAGTQPTSVIPVDLNGDLKLDLGVANETSDNVSVFLGNGNGTFTTATSFATDNGPVVITNDDVNKDGKQDLITANRAANTATVLLGNGNGILRNAITSATSGQPRDGTTGDFNGDGKLDVAVAIEGNGSVNLLLGNGNGTFQTAQSFAAGTTPHVLTSGDFNNDGKLDVAVSNFGVNQVNILLGNGNGTLQAPISIGSAGSDVEQIIAADFNGDNKLDVGLASIGASPTSSVAILLGNGNGTLQAAQFFQGGPNATSLVSGDFNGDSKLDLAVANAGNANSASILLGNGNGTFAAGTSFVTGTTSSFVVTGDFNGDSKLDLAVSNFASDNVSIALGNGNGTFGAATNFAVGDGPTALAIGDFNQDGKLDLASINNQGSDTSLLLGNGNGTFGTAVDYLSGAEGVSGSVGDFNGDKVSDILVANEAAANVAVLLDIKGTTTTLTSSANPSTFFQTITLTATVTPATTGVGIPNGQVTFLNGTTNLGTAALNAQGVATLQVNTLPVGTHSLTAVYQGATEFNTSTSAALTQTVSKGTTTVALSSSANPVPSGQPITLTGIISPGSFFMGQNAQTGTMTFFDGTTALGTVPLTQTSPTPGPVSSSTGILTVTLSPGTHNITATYNGDSQWAASTSPPLVQVVQQQAATVQINSQRNPSALGQPVTIEVSVMLFLQSLPPNPGTGTVTLLINNVEIATQTLQNGFTLFTTSAFKAGANTVTGRYNGGNFAPGSATYTQNVQGPGAGQTPQSNFVALAYQTMLGRLPQPSEVTFWTNTLASGATRQQVATAIAESVEFENGAITSLYKSVLGRNPDPGGLANSLAYLQGGGTLQGLQTILLTSNEFFALKGGTNSGFVQGVYQVALGRAGSSAEIQSWVNLLNSGASRTFVAQSIQGSPEGLAFGVTQLYQTFLFRAPDPGGLATFSAALAQGTSVQLLIGDMVGSQEFYNDANATLYPAYIANLYQDLLGRSPAASETQYWVGLLQAGISPANVVSLIGASQEFITRIITQQYQIYLNRAPDPQGLASFVALLSTPGPGNLQEMLDIIVTSPEYAQITGGTNQGYLQGLYQDALGRPIDQPTLQLLLPQLNAGTLSRAQVANIVFFSTEYYNLTISNVYLTLLNRQADSSGLAAWINVVLSNGGQFLPVIAGIGSSNEYFGLS